MSSSSSPPPPSLDPRIWKACAGAGAGKIHTAGSTVYYFPQGHAEQSSSPIDLASISIKNPFPLCTVIAVHHQANPDSDEVFSRIRLRPIPSGAAFLPPPRPPEGGGVGGGGEVVSFAKVLTPSDANNGGGFSVPRFCADSIFPALDYNADPPVQNIFISDVHGNVWEFRHIYRGTPRRHLLTTGWSKFVNSKKLVAGDSVVFINNGEGKLFVGIRRIGRSCGNPEFLKLDEKMSSAASKDGFSRNVKGRVPADSIVEAIRLMEMGREFEVMYYPRAGSPEFVVEQEVVDKSLRLCWSEGMRIKMSVETEDSSRMTWFQGKVTRNNVRDTGLWSYSPWRMLQVTWDEPEVLPNVIAVSPWQVELVSTSHHMHAPFPPMKKLKAQGLELSSDGHGSIVFPQSLTDSMKMGNLTPFPTFPAGMQGARHGFCLPSLPDFLHRNTNQMFSDNFYGIKLPEELNRTQTEAASPPSQESIHNHDQDLLGVAACTQTRKVSKGSIQLFGKIIHTKDPDDDSVDGEYAANEGVRSLEFSLSFQHNPLFDGVDVQRQRISAAEA